MSNIIKKPSASYWIMGVIFLLWNAFGCYLYVMDQTMSDAAYIAAYGEAMNEVRNLYPTWSVAAYAIAVWGGLLAAVFYLLRKRWAATLFVVSLIAAIISFMWGLTNAEAKAAAGSTSWVMPLIVVAIGAFEIWWTRQKKVQGLLT